MKAADRSGARFAVLIGAEERRNATVRIKDLRDGDQQDVAAAEAAHWLVNTLAGDEAE
jgi:histidyl-tRNA synthetase